MRPRDPLLVAGALFVVLLVSWRALEVRRPLPHARSRATPDVLSTSEPPRPKVLEATPTPPPPATRVVTRAPPVRLAPQRPQESYGASVAPAPGSCAREIDKCAEGSVGSATTCFNLGRMYETGMCGAEDPVAARRAFQRSCDLGDRAACLLAGHRAS